MNRYDIDYPIGNIVDMIILPGEVASLHFLFDCAISFFDEREINQVNFLCVRDTSSMKAALKKYGFFNAPKNFHMWFARRNSFNTDFLESTPADRLHFSFGDTDWI